MFAPGYLELLIIGLVLASLIVPLVIVVVVVVLLNRGKRRDEGVDDQ